ncbi:DNA replication protein DnaC [Anaerobacterium chartisolvens]|uniref:DNA replication protein DnaC n=1 Tax=Anaerobacterium chartisolvens TaxID=1297424 RepID=A0A369B6A7_9FIRM|nr:ATP-binding protein [Anaerobacterium chartisolvens]RCX16067.1 DNA replication protein DnaC [Anaerobacterium chartisolvens]
MNRHIYQSIKKEYDDRQRAAVDRFMAKKSQAYLLVPGLEEIDKEINLSGIKYNRMLLVENSAKDNLLEEFTRTLRVLKTKRETLLLKHGYTADHLEIAYTCPKCKDTGFIENPAGAEKCSCYKQMLINAIYSQSNLKLVQKENFSAFNEHVYPETSDESRYGLKISPRENILNIKRRCLSFIENFNSSDEKNLFFSGPTGVGKTFMSNCIALELMKKGHTVLYQTAPVLFNTIAEFKMKAYKEDDFEDGNYSSIFEVGLLIIDDLGTESQTAARYAELLTIINTRQMNNFSSPCKTIISTNIGARKLDEYYTERVSSRIIGCFDRLMFIGDDIRRNIR